MKWIKNNFVIILKYSPVFSTQFNIYKFVYPLTQLHNSARRFNVVRFSVQRSLDNQNAIAVMQDSCCKVLQGTKGIYKDKVERCLKCNRIHFRQRGYREYDLYRQNQYQKCYSTSTMQSPWQRKRIFCIDLVTLQSQSIRVS